MLIDYKSVESRDSRISFSDWLSVKDSAETDRKDRNKRIERDKEIVRTETTDETRRRGIVTWSKIDQLFSFHLRGSSDLYVSYHIPLSPFMLLPVFIEPLGGRV